MGVSRTPDRRAEVTRRAWHAGRWFAVLPPRNAMQGNTDARTGTDERAFIAEDFSTLVGSHATLASGVRESVPDRRETCVRTDAAPL